MVAMPTAHLLASLVWYIHGSRLISGLEVAHLSDNFEVLMDNPNDLNLNTALEWLVEFEADVLAAELDAF